MSLLLATTPATYAVLGDIHSCSISQKVYLQAMGQKQKLKLCDIPCLCRSRFSEATVVCQGTYSKSICRGFTMRLKYVEKYPCALLTLLRAACGPLVVSVVGSILPVLLNLLWPVGLAKQLHPDFQTSA